jgi:hypothetical protein
LQDSVFQGQHGRRGTVSVHSCCPLSLLPFVGAFNRYVFALV